MNSPGDTQATTPATLIVRRKSSWIAMLRAFKVYVDDKKLASLKSGEETRLEIAPGHHKIDVLGALWSKSEVYDIDVQPGQTVTFECGVRSKGLFIVMAIFFAWNVAKPVLNHMPGGVWLVLVGSLLVFVMCLAYFAMSFKRGTMYYLHQKDS